VRVKGVGRIADGIDAAVHAMQPALAHTAHDRVFVQTAVTELIDPDLAVLTGSQPSGAQVRGCVEFLARAAICSTHPG